MPGTHPRNAGLVGGGSTAAEAARHGHDTQRLSIWHNAKCGRQNFDAIRLLADDEPGRVAVLAMVRRRYATRARTLARRRETVQRAQEAADALGWTLTADERDMLESFVQGRETKVASHA